jgi:hypothetical protein
MNVKEDFFARGSFVISNGRNTRFWEDIWLGDKSLADEDPTLYNIVYHKQVTVESVMDSTPLNIGFRRTLGGNKWDSWIHLLQQLILVQLTDVDDVFRWNFTTSEFFFCNQCIMTCSMIILFILRNIFGR